MSSARPSRGRHALATDIGGVAVALLELSDKNGVIRAQWPTAVCVLVVNIFCRIHAAPTAMTNPRTILLTGFEPFGGEAVNPSWEIARALDGWLCEDHVVRGERLPCAFGDALRALDAALAAHRPALVLCLGEAGGRAEISIERVALNVDDARIPDNLGRQPIDTAVVAGGPAAYFSTLPIKSLARDIHAAGIAAAVSNTAGTFVCNHVFYALMHRLATVPALATARGGFVHVPCTPEQAAGRPGVPAMALAAQVDGIRHALRSALRTRDDVRETAGREH